jgi:Ca-activated chloride channel family protein
LIAIWAGGGVVLLVALAEMLHTWRVRRIRRLAFGPGEQPRPWTRVVAPLRCVCLGAFTWALATLFLAGSGLFGDTASRVGSGTRHVVFVADLSPSMYLQDAGPRRDLTRRARMAEVVEGVLDRVGGDVTFSVIGFYTNALPVVLQVRDRAVVRNVFAGMPLVYAMAVGQTDLALSIGKAMELIESFPKSSAIVFVCTDGDTVTFAHPLYAPASVERMTVLGVGDRERGTFIDGHQSRQDAQVLRSIAASLSAEYIDVNDRHVPTASLGGLVLGPRQGGRLSRVEMAILMLSLTATILAFIPVAQQYAGTSWRIALPRMARSPRPEAT